MPATQARDWPNLIAYPLVVLGVTFVFMPPFVVIVGLWALWARRDTAGARFTGWWLAGSVAVALPYFFQSPRFLAPAMMLVLVYTAVGIVDLCGTARGRFVHRRSTVLPPEGAGVPELASR